MISKFLTLINIFIIIILLLLNIIFFPYICDLLIIIISKIWFIIYAYKDFRIFLQNNIYI